VTQPRYDVVPFRDLLAEPLRNGVYKRKEFHGRGLKIVNMKELFANDRLRDQANLRVDLTAAEQGRFVLRPGDLLFARRSFVLEGAGKCSIVEDTDEPTVFESSMIRARLAEHADPRFFYYLFKSPLGRGAMASIATRTAVSGITGSALAGLPVPLPPLGVQRKIAGVLVAYDDLIENNVRRIDLLEGMAKALYREWFVEGRFPGHQDVPLVESELGPVPSGWPVVSMSDVVSVDKGLSYKGAYLTDTGVPMANLKCLRAGGGFRRDGTKPYSGEFKPRHAIAPGDLIVANTDLTQAGHVIGSPAIVPRRDFQQGGLVSHHLFAVRHDRSEIPASFLYHLLADDRFRSYARGTASGTTVLGFRAADFLSFRFALPPTPLIDSFASLAGDMVSLAEVLEDENEVLRTNRDLLLPRLVAGDVDLAQCDIDMAPLVA
jgi:type I restriction enzyme, S subunit